MKAFYDQLRNLVSSATTRIIKGGSMALSFPNDSRSYDVTRRAVRFWGYDRAMETSFFITEDALSSFQPGVAIDHASALQAFDNNRPLIYATAAKVYARGHKGSYELVGGDFI